MAVLSPITNDLKTPDVPPIRGRFDLAAPTHGGCSARPLQVVLNGWVKAAGSLGDQSIEQAWQRHGDALLDGAVGDYALVAWDPASTRLCLARSPLSSRPLFFRRDGSTSISVSSLAADLAGPNRAIDFDAIAQWYGALVGTSIEPMFSGVERAEPGTVVAFSPSGSSVRRFWDARTIEPDHAQSDRDLADRLRQALHDAIADAMAGGHIATLLSAGRDSGCVSAMAASQLARQGTPIDSYTSSPGLGRPLDEEDRLVDEAQGAASVAARYPNIRHHLVTPRRVPFCATIEEVYRNHSAPLGNPLSLYWWTEIQRQAAGAGCKTILTGGMGNLTISDGGPSYLAELVGSRHWRRWWSQAKEIAGFEGASWLNVTNLSIGGRIPEMPYGMVQRLYGRRLPPRVSRYLGGSLKQAVEAAHRRQDQRPPARPRRLGQEMLTTMELGDISPDMMFGVSMRDPTADRRVVEASLAIPADRLVSRYDRRPIFELAFGDLLPTETIRAPRRAYQSMDWNLAYDVDELRSGLARYSDHRSVRDCVDIDAMKEGLGRWPVGRFATLEETGDLGEGLLRAFALAAFLWVHAPA